MNSCFKDSLPPDLVTHVTSMCGEKGEEWLEGLAETISELENLWAIKVQEPFPAGEFNFVAPALRDDERTVLKISPPFDTIEILGEAEYLRSRDGRGAVKLLAENADRRAILIEHALPGKNLTDCFEDNKPKAVKPAVEVLHSILRPPPSARINVTMLDKWFAGLERFSATDFPTSYSMKALRIHEKLAGQPNRTYYLHGDFHPGNIVSATREPFLAIDPKGVIGHIGYEIAVFLNNFHWWQEGEPDIEARLEKAIRQFSESFDIDPVQLRQWAFAQMVLGAWCTFDEMPENYNDEVANADIWNV